MLYIYIYVCVCVCVYLATYVSLTHISHLHVTASLELTHPDITFITKRIERIKPNIVYLPPNQSIFTTRCDLSLHRFQGHDVKWNMKHTLELRGSMSQIFVIKHNEYLFI